MKKVLYNTCYGGFGLSKEFIKSLGVDPYDYENYPFYSRDDQEFIQKVLDFGLKEASGPYASLAVTEIPDICSYMIDEYDGVESVNTTLHVSMDELESGLSKEKLDVLYKNPHISIVVTSEHQEADYWNGDESDKTLQ